MFKIDHNFDYKVFHNNFIAPTSAFVFNKEILRQYLACYDSLKKVMKKDVYYYLCNTSSDFKYCIENERSTYKLVTYFYECPPELDLSDLVDYTRTHHNAIRQRCADIELFIDCRALFHFSKR